MNFVENIDRIIFLFLNGLNSSWIDQVMFFLSSFWIWIPIIVLFIYMAVKVFKKKFWIPMLFVIVCFAITDQGTNLLKKTVKRNRPTHNTEISQQVHTVNAYRGGQYGFFSGHAANSFGLAFLSLLFIRKKYYTIIVIIWASLVSYSRIYLGVHYPSDVIVGIIYGSAIAYLLYYVCKRMLNKKIGLVQ
jgi:undecaprenyl-diphosphatase